MSRDVSYALQRSTIAIHSQQQPPVSSVMSSLAAPPAKKAKTSAAPAAGPPTAASSSATNDLTALTTAQLYSVSAKRNSDNSREFVRLAQEERDRAQAAVREMQSRLEHEKERLKRANEHLKKMKENSKDADQEYLHSKRFLLQVSQSSNPMAVPMNIALEDSNVGSNMTNSEGVRLVAQLSKCPRTLYALWEEWAVGSATQKPVRLWSARERGAQKHSIYKRKFLWDKVRELVLAGRAAHEACDLIYSVYGENLSVTMILEKLRADAKTGGHPQLRASKESSLV